MTWTADGTSIGDVFDEKRTYDTLVLRTRADASTVNGKLSEFEAVAGKYRKLVYNDGSFGVVDRSSSGNKFSLAPPSGRTTLRQSTDYAVMSYGHQVIDQDGDYFEATIAFIPYSAREPTGTEVSQTRSTGEWLFDFSSGATATRRIRAESKSEAQSAVSSYEIRAFLSQEQGRTLEASASYQKSAGIREVSDGVNFGYDASGGNRNTVTVTAPTNGGDVLPGGTYVIDGWESEWVSDAIYEVRMTLVEKG